MNKQRIDQPNTNYFNKLPKDVLNIVFGFFSHHEKLCQLSAVCHKFMSVIQESDRNNQALKLLSEKGQSLNLPYNQYRLFHSSHLHSDEFDNLVEADWSFAAFMGDIETGKKLLGDNYGHHKDESERTVAHFAALGGQLPLLKNLEKEFGEGVIQTTDAGGFNCAHFAAIHLHLHTLQWLVKEKGFSLLDKTDKKMGSISPLDHIKNFISNNKTLRRICISDTSSLIIADLLCHSLQKNPTVLETSDNHEVPEKYLADPNQLNEKELVQTIISLVHDILTENKSYFTELAALVANNNILSIKDNAPRFTY